MTDHQTPTLGIAGLLGRAADEVWASAITQRRGRGENAIDQLHADADQLRALAQTFSGLTRDSVGAVLATLTHQAGSDHYAVSYRVECERIANLLRALAGSPK